MYIRNNLLGMKIANNNKNINKKLEKSIKKLSSGYRINIAADDAAGISISEKMKGQIRGLKAATRNALDASSSMEVRDGALDEVHHMMQRMRELTIQSLSDSNTDEDRSNIQKEFRELQTAVSDITRKTQFNTKSVFESHESSYDRFEGNNKFDDLMKIVDGFNNDLEISVDGNITKISIDEGYYSSGEIADIIDSKLMEANPDLIINLTGENSFSLQAENHLSIDYIKGGLSFLFYEYHLGNPPGMIIGVTEFKENGKLPIIKGSNDELSFHLGVSKEYSIKFDANSEGYSIDELIEIINNQLEDEGEEDVKAIKYLDKHIALTSDKHVITGLSGNMIKIDQITSVIYDNAKHGKISKSQGYILSRKDISEGVKIEKGKNNILKLEIDGSENIEIDLYEDGEEDYSLEDLITKINAVAKEEKIGIIASGTNRLKIESKYYGKGSSVKISSDSTAYEDLFVLKEERKLKPNIIEGKESSAEIIGKYVIEENIKITEGKNDRLKFTIDGEERTVILEGKKYSSEDLITEISSQLNKEERNDVNVELLGPQDGKKAIYIKNKNIGKGSIKISESSNGFESLFCKLEHSSVINSPGITTIIQDEEGIVGEIKFKETSATLTGRVNIDSDVIIDGSNNKLKFNSSGENVEITLDHGKFNADELVTMLSDKLIEENVEVELDKNSVYGTNLKFTTKEKGENQFFKEIGGSAYNTILSGKAYIKPETSSKGIASQSSIIGRRKIENNFKIDDSNNKLLFNYVVDKEKYNINIELEKNTYADSEKLKEELNKQIGEKLKELGLTGDEIFAKSVDNRIEIKTKEVGGKYKLEDVKGNFYEEVLTNTVTSKGFPYSYTGYENSKENQLTYIVGRENLNKEMIINPNVNDALTFDFYKNGTKETFKLILEPGKYNGQSMKEEIQNQINKELKKKDLDSNMLKVQIGGIHSGTAVDDEGKLVIKYNNETNGENNSGNYIIDGVRGSAAYTIFYKAEGEPSPTHTIGMTDLSEGVIIETGVNDTFTMDINGEEKTIVLEAKEYTSEELLSVLNTKLEKVSVIASYYEGNLKLSFAEVGANTIDGIRGNAKGTLFFNGDNREFDVDEFYQVGPNSGDSLKFNKSRVSGELMRINTITIHKSSFVNKALGRLDNAINYVSSERGRIGATQNRLESIIRNNKNQEENLTAAESKIRDIDMAREITEFTKKQILGQATQAILVQANHMPDVVLQLLK